MAKISIPVLLGTAREERLSERAARFVFGELQKHPEVEAVFVDIRDHLRLETLPPYGAGGADEKPTPWKKIMERADGLIIVSPEYNRGYPGELKILLDSLYKEYNRKPVMVVGVSDGPIGGTRLMEHIKSPLIEFRMVPIRHRLFFPYVDKVFNDNGEIQDESYVKKAKEGFGELVWYARALRDAREKGLPELG